MPKLRKKDRKKAQKTFQRVRAFVPVAPRTRNQADAMKIIRNNTISIVVGTAGTGKTLIAISEALLAITNGTAKRMVLIRPMVAVGESLGYLPGDVLDKVAPYATPLLYYIDDLMGSKGYAQKLIEAGVIEVVPLALIRGRTFDDSFIIMDEAQNTTTEQMHAALTRIGTDSSMTLVGDTRQCDLKGNTESGLMDLIIRMEDHEDGDSIIEFTAEDIQRNEILKKIHTWYEDGATDEYI